MRTLGALAVLVAVVCLSGVGGAAAPAGLTPARGCRIYADIPRPPAGATSGDRLFAWAEVHCAAPTTVTVRVCASRSAPFGLHDYRMAWCQFRTVRVQTRKAAFVRTAVHPCTLGMLYRSEATLDGLSQDVGPSISCRR